MRRFNWYRTWHGWNYHKHVHGLIAAVYVLAVVVTTLTAYQIAFAFDQTDSWDFSTPADYAVSAGAEINGNTARLKTQAYSSDDDTMALYHMDESSGSTTADSSPNNNTASVSNGTFGASQVGNGLSFNGTTSRATAPDSASLSIAQQNTLESWLKLNAGFSAGSHTQRQGIVDKGSYQLYLDDQTGKLTYELADASATSWNQVGGNSQNNSWDLDGKRSVNTFANNGTTIYAGIGGDSGDAEVWRWDGSAWTKIGGGSNSVNNSWEAQTFEGVYSLATDGTNVYAGLGSSTGDAEVWRFNGTSWAKIGGDGLNSGWALTTFEKVFSLTYFNSTLYAALGDPGTAGDAEVWAWNGSVWTQVGGDSINSGWDATYEISASLANDGTNLYAGLGNNSGDGELWRYDGSAWTKIGGDAINNGWGTSTETVASLYFAGSTLYAGLGSTPGDAEVWSWDGSTWTKIGGDALNSSWANTTYEEVLSLAHDGTSLYAGIGNSNGEGEVWRYSGSTWTQIGGDGLNSGWAASQADSVSALLHTGGFLYSGTTIASGGGLAFRWNDADWTQIGGDYVNDSWGFYGTSVVRTLHTSNDNLYAGLGNTAGAALVFQFDGSTWSLIGGQGVNGSWSINSYEQITSMASFNGKLYVGLGTSADDAEVWEWNGSTWTKSGGDSVNSSWGSGFTEVTALVAHGGNLYAGLGTAADDAEVWQFNGSSWTKIGGDSLNSGWTTGFDRVKSMASYDGRLQAGIGSSTTEGEVWEWSGSAWVKIGGDGTNSSWSNDYEQVESLFPYNGKLYAGLGNNSDDAEVWEWNGSTWTKSGGDSVNSSWTSGTFESVTAFTAYNGSLYAGLGTDTGDGEIWRLDSSTWSKVAGDGLNGAWGSGVEETSSLRTYKGKLYAGTGSTATADANVWALGNNGYLQSASSSFDTNWHHIAATYDGSVMRLYIDGALNNSAAASLSLPDNTNQLSIGNLHSGDGLGIFDGMLDELRISDVARSTFFFKPYSNAPQTVTLANAVRQSGTWHWDNYTTTETLDGGTITYRLSDDDGTTWKYWNGSGWVESANTSEANSAADITANIATFPVTFAGIKWQAVLLGNGDQLVALNNVVLDSTSDTTVPDASAVTISALKAPGGSVLASNAWTNGGSPYFSWTDATDTESGIRGYCAYLGTSSSADPQTTKGLLGSSPTATGGHCQFVTDGVDLDLSIPGRLGTALSTSNSPYYLIIKAIDIAGNVSSETAQFQFRFDNTIPDNPDFVEGPLGYQSDKTAQLFWPTTGDEGPRDDNSGIAGLQYRIGSAGTWYGDAHIGSGDIDDLLVNDGDYTTQDPPDFDNLQEGVNTVYFRTWDTAGNVTTSYVTTVIKINTTGSPSEPQNLFAVPDTNTTNEFEFFWDPPASFVGNVDNITYCYTVNVVPSETSCTFTEPGVLTLPPGPYATQFGTNTLYVVARDEADNINYTVFASVDFTADTTAPGIPLNLEIADVSIRSTSNWRLALSWNTPADIGSGVAGYQIYRSTDNVNFAPVGSSSTTTYVDTGLSQVTYYYKIRACDSVNNCGAFTSVVSMLPEGRFTTPPNLVAQPQISNVTTKHATITWSTDRTSSSSIAIGTSSGSYNPSEVSNPALVTDHQIDLDNLSAATTYYFVAKWTDSDGNTGQSQEFSFTTLPAPSFKDVVTFKIGLSSSSISFTSKNAVKVTLMYGQTEEFTGIQTINTSTEESTYTINLIGLADGTRYVFRLIGYDAEGTAYESSTFSFTTPVRPIISNLRFQPIPGEPTSTQQVTWQTNVPTTSVVTYGKVGTSGQDVSNSSLVTDHQIVIRNLEDDSEYFLIAQSRDADGNLAVSDRQVFHTALDTRPPQISEISIESSLRGTGAETRGQAIVSWRTDEPATSQVAYTEGSGAVTFSSRTAEDTALAFEHIVIVSDLPTSKVYSIQPVSRDKAENVGTGETQSAIIGRASDDVLTIVLETLRRIFGF